MYNFNQIARFIEYVAHYNDNYLSVISIEYSDLIYTLYLIKYNDEYGEFYVKHSEFDKWIIEQRRNKLLKLKMHG